MKENKGILVFAITVYFITNCTINLLIHNDVVKQIQQSKEHHEKYHELIKENYRLNEWYQNWSINNDCDTFRQPTSVSIECEKYEL